MFGLLHSVALLMNTIHSVPTILYRDLKTSKHVNIMSQVCESVLSI